MNLTVYQRSTVLARQIASTTTEALTDQTFMGKLFMHISFD